MHRYAIILAILFLSACSDENNSPQAAKPEADKTARNPAQRSNFADPQIQAYKKSQQVQNTVDETVKKRREEMKDQGI